MMAQHAPARVTRIASKIAQNRRRESRRVTSAIFSPVAAEAMTKVRMSAAQAKFRPRTVRPAGPTREVPSALTVSTGAATGATP